MNRRGGFILWFTGLSGAGKSTLSKAVSPVLATEFPVEILDGDEVRTYLSRGLTFSKQDRDTNIRRIGFVARLLARNGVATIAAAISPYAELRSEVRRLAEADGVTFIEVHVDAPIATLTARDTKGLYRKALAGELAHFTGISDPYEPPTAPDIVVHSDRESIEDSLRRIVAYLRERELVGTESAPRKGYEI
jgi:adenylyl-sulfate kinase